MSAWLSSVNQIQRYLSEDISILLTGGIEANFAFNSYDSTQIGYVPNQKRSIPELLTYGIRFFQLEFHSINGTLLACRINPVVKNWCTEHPTECQNNQNPGCPPNARTAESVLSDFYAWIRSYTNDILVFEVVHDESDFDQVNSLFARVFAGIVLNTEQKQSIYGSNWPSISQLRQTPYSVLWFGTPSPFWPSQSNNYVMRYNFPCSAGTERKPANTPAKFYALSDVVTINGQTVFDGPTLTGSVSNSMLRQMMECDMFVGLDNLNTDQNGLLGSSIWSFQRLHPNRNNNTNCAMMGAGPEYYWIEANCSLALKVACQSETDPMLWTLSEKTHSWYSAYNNSNSNETVCPVGFQFQVPSVGSQNAALRTYLGGQPALSGVWIKLNDIDEDGSWKRTWSGVIPPQYDPPGTFWDDAEKWARAAYDRWPYILGAVLLFFAICIPATFLICRRIKKRRLQRGFREFNDSVSLEDK